MEMSEGDCCSLLTVCGSELPWIPLSTPKIDTQKDCQINHTTTEHVSQQIPNKYLFHTKLSQCKNA